jgi:antitoxin component YwqK of YwqJK toxin-antitoxin module
VWIWVIATVISCAASPSSLRSNFASVRLGEGRILATNGEPYTGTLVARDQEIIAIARGVVDAPMLERVDRIDPTGLILVLPVEGGLPSGVASIHVDLHAGKLNPEVARRGTETVLLARALGPTIKVAEATFRAGKLDGPATLYEPRATGPSKVAEAELRDNRLHGTARELFPGTTRVKRELHFAHGVQSGAERAFYETGKLEREAMYVAGKRHGELRAFYANGARRALSRFANGVPIGAHETWYPSGTRKSRIVFDAGEVKSESQWYSNGGSMDAPPNGLVEEFHANGAVHTRTHYVAGAKHGAFAAFYADGKRWKAGAFDHDKQHGPYETWWKNGKRALVSTYVAGQLDGDYRRWYASGQEWERAQYALGKRIGPYRKWWKNGKPAHVYAYKEGRLDGEYLMFYDDGAKWAVGRYERGKAQGTIQRWFRDGRLGYVMHHERGRPHGEYKRWYADGKPRLEATYVDGNLHGELKNWLADGTVFELATYERGLKVKTSRATAP